jgi:hypothetical protein
MSRFTWHTYHPAGLVRQEIVRGGRCSDQKKGDTGLVQPASRIGSGDALLALAYEIIEYSGEHYGRDWSCTTAARAWCPRGRALRDRSAPNERCPRPKLRSRRNRQRKIPISEALVESSPCAIRTVNLSLCVIALSLWSLDPLLTMQSAGRIPAICA